MWTTLGKVHMAEHVAGMAGEGLEDKLVTERGGIYSILMHSSTV